MKTKSVSQNNTKTFLKNAIPFIVGPVALCASLTTTLADQCIGTTDWIVTSGDWFERINWSEGLPNGDTSAKINNGGTATIASAGAVSCDLTLGAEQMQSGAVVVDGGTYAMTFDAAVAEHGKGVLTIKNGGSVTAAYSGIATEPGSNGTVSVSGGTFTIEGNGALGVGGYSAPGGIGLLSVTNGGTVTAGTVQVWKSGTLTGNGTVTGGTSIQGTLTPGGGTLAITGNLAFSVTPSSSPTIECNVVPTRADNVCVTGTATLNGRISVTLTGTTFTAGSTYTLLHANGGLNSTSFSIISI